MSMGKNIAALRKAAGWTQAELGHRLGVSNQAVSKWESGISLPDVLLLPKIAKEFGVTIDRLFEGVGVDGEEEIPRNLLWVLRQNYDGADLIIRYPIRAMMRMLEAQLEAAGIEPGAEDWVEFREMWSHPGIVREQESKFFGKMTIVVEEYED